MKTICLTIDDAPSRYTNEKISFLVEHRIPALFFCLGNAIEKHKESVVELIKNGFLVGNHSYSHPYFSKLSLEECFQEILRTEVLIEECYAKAEVERPMKVIRLPFGDEGTGDQVEKIQAFLKKEGFRNPFSMGWDWDTFDYKKAMMQNAEEYMQGLYDHWESSTLDKEVILIHDFDRNHHMFMPTMQFLLSKGVSFSHAI